VCSSDLDGEGHRVDLHDVEIAKPHKRGVPLSQLLSTTLATDVIGAVPLLDDPDGWTVVTVSAQGTVKRTELAEYSESRVRSIQVAGTKDGDALTAALLCRDDDDLLLATDESQVARFAAEEVRPMGRTASGVAGMNTGAGSIVSATVVPGGSDDHEVFTVGAQGQIKRTPVAEYSRTGRGVKGVLTGVEATRWCGIATHVHIAGDDGWSVVRPVDAPARGRSSGGDPMGFAVERAVGEVDAEELAARTRS
jgi:DNA gyrase subunit A